MAATIDGSNALGRPSKRALATWGTADDRSRSMTPVANRNRTKVRRVAT